MSNDLWTDEELDCLIDDPQDGTADLVVSLAAALREARACVVNLKKTVGIAQLRLDLSSDTGWKDVGVAIANVYRRAETAEKRVAELEPTLRRLASYGCLCSNPGDDSCGACVARVALVALGL